MSRFTLARAAGIIGVIAVGCGAMRAATEEGERIVFALTLALHSAALLGAGLRRGKDPAWSGFVVLGWAFFLAVTTGTFSGPAGNSDLPAADLAAAASAIAQPEPKAPVVGGVLLDTEPDKMTATDAMIQAHKAFTKATQDWSDRERHVRDIADLLGSILAALAGAWLGPWLAPRIDPDPTGIDRGGPEPIASD